MAYSTVYESEDLAKSSDSYTIHALELNLPLYRNLRTGFESSDSYMTTCVYIAYRNGIQHCVVCINLRTWLSPLFTIQYMCIYRSHATLYMWASEDVSHCYCFSVNFAIILLTSKPFSIRIALINKRSFTKQGNIFMA